MDHDGSLIIADLSRFDAELSNLLVGSVLIAIVSFLENYSIASVQNIAIQPEPNHNLFFAFRPDVQ